MHQFFNVRFNSLCRLHHPWAVSPVRSICPWAWWSQRLMLWALTLVAAFATLFFRFDFRRLFWFSGRFRHRWSAGEENIVNLLKLLQVKTYFFRSCVCQLLAFVLKNNFGFAFSETFFQLLSWLLFLLQSLLNLLLGFDNLFFVDQIQNLIQLLLIKLDIFFSDCFDDLWNGDWDGGLILTISKLMVNRRR